jgi:hypothetical protein
MLVIACFTSLAVGQEPFTIEATTAATFAQLPKPWRSILDSRGSQLVTSVNGISTTVMEIWWSKAVPGLNKAPVLPQVNYSQLQAGAVVGVLHFLADSPEDFLEDSRDQKLEPGFYSLRYAQLSLEGPEGGSSPYKDVVLLSRLDVDRKPERVLPSEELMQLSRRASQTQNPAAITLLPPNPAYKHLPAVIADDSGQWILQANISVAIADGKHTRESPLAIVLVTPSKESGPS